jgi:hypothetical protein
MLSSLSEEQEVSEPNTVAACVWLGNDVEQWNVETKNETKNEPHCSKSRTVTRRRGKQQENAGRMDF